MSDSDIPTGSPMLDAFIDGAGASNTRLMIGGLLFISLLYLFIIIVNGRTPYPIYAAFYNMAFWAVTVMIPGAVTGNNVVGNGLSTAALSIGQLWMFGMMLLKMPYERH